MTNEELEEAIADCGGRLAEVEGEHANETALFGDSWPGAQLDIAAIRQVYRELLNMRKPRPVEIEEQIEDDDLPF